MYRQKSEKALLGGGGGMPPPPAPLPPLATLMAVGLGLGVGQGSTINIDVRSNNGLRHETIDIFSILVYFGRYFFVKFYPTIGQLITQLKI